MSHAAQFYIDGKWVEPAAPSWFEMVDPATEAPVGQLALGDAADVDRAVAAARRAFADYSAVSVADRIDLLRRIVTIYERRYDEFAQAMRVEMGAPIAFARKGQACAWSRALEHVDRRAGAFEFEERPWHYALAPRTDRRMRVDHAVELADQPDRRQDRSGACGRCTMVLKPSEYSPLSALLFAEVLDEAGVPPGVFNLVNGDGPGVGAAIAAHPGIDMVSFTGSTRAGILVAKMAAETVKRVAQELGGKSANILLDDVNLDDAVARGVAACFTNSGQSCSIPTRMLVPRHLMSDATQIAKRTAETFGVGPTDSDATQLGPLVNRNQFDRVQALIQRGIDEGARLVTGRVPGGREDWRKASSSSRPFSPMSRPA